MSRNEVEDEEDTVVDDELTLELEEEGEYIPPGYLAAVGRYRHFCTCNNDETCDFCKWFSLIKSCKVHGKSTQRPFRSCACHTDDALGKWSSKLVDDKSKDRRRVTCSCLKREPASEETCTCLDDVKSVSSDELPPRWDQGNRFEELNVAIAMYDFENEGEGQSRRENEWINPEVEREDEWGENEDDTVKTSVRILLKGRVDVESEYFAKAESETAPLQPCTCNEIPPSCSGSTTEIETSATSTTDPSATPSYSDLTIGAGVEDTSSDPGSSEQSSVNAVEIDPTRVKWTTPASDDSFDNSSSDEATPPQPIDFSVRRIQRQRQRRAPPKTKGPDERRLHHYLLLQKSHPKNYSQICKSKRDQAKSYSLTLMNLGSRM